LLITRYVGLGISHFPAEDSAKYGTEAYPVNCPWFWHHSANRVFMKGDQVGCVGCVKGGYYLINFFINENLFKGDEYGEYYNNSERKSLKSDKEAYIHFAVVTGEKFTICRPKLGYQYYIKKFKESDVYNGREISSKGTNAFY
jgi:hypothetical protein